jgi:hypothetical protein
MKQLKQHFTITTIVSLVVYLMAAFIRWDLTFITELPELKPIDRIPYLCFFFAIHSITALVLWSENEENEDD